jgi:hypothetical protein
MRATVKNMQLPPKNYKRRESNYFLDALPAPIRNTPVPHTAQIPLVAGLPFFKVTAVGFFISTFLRHLTQYASTLFAIIITFQLNIKNDDTTNNTLIF